MATMDMTRMPALQTINQPLRRAYRQRLALIGLLIGLVVAILFAVGIGAVAIAPGQVLAILAKQIGITLPWAFTEQQAAVLLAIRIPRVLLGSLIGAGLAVSGAALQGLFRNPLADPGLIGVSSGAALAAVATIVLGATFASALFQTLGLFTLPLVAFAGSVGATLLVYQLSLVAGRTVVATMLLAGIAVNALLGAFTGLLTFVATDAQLRNITFWGLGSVSGATWRSVWAVMPFIALTLLLLPRLARPLNALALGEAEANHLGFAVERTKRLIVVLVALTVGASVALTGIIGFVGLLVPHLLRLLVGPDHRVLLPGSALLGATLLLLADLVARTIVAPAELPIGIVTAMIGAPTFLWLLLRDRRRFVL
ncbi:MAG: iron ABC transporter permease [Caldilineaceae bacterium]|nr:iron ABC transporter permease [Caldilineaceae bacterium]